MPKVMELLRSTNFIKLAEFINPAGICTLLR